MAEIETEIKQHKEEFAEIYKAHEKSTKKMAKVEKVVLKFFENLKKKFKIKKKLTKKSSKKVKIEHSGNASK